MSSVSGLKTLAQLWQENGEKPFWATFIDSRYGTQYFYCMGKNPVCNGYAVGVNNNGFTLLHGADTCVWSFCEDPTKPKPKMRIWLDTNTQILAYSYKVPCVNFRDGWKDVTDEIRALLKGDDE